MLLDIEKISVQREVNFYINRCLVAILDFPYKQQEEFCFFFNLKFYCD